MKKEFGILLSAVLFASAGGCGPKQTEAPVTPPQAPAAAPGTPSDTPAAPVSTDPYPEYDFDLGKTYTYEWCVGELNAPVDDDAPVKQLLEERYNVKFNIWYVDRSKRDELLTIRFTSGDFPDILSTSGAVATASYYNQGLLAELPVDLIENKMPIIAKATNDVGELEGINPYVVTTFDGKNYGLPSMNYNGKYHYSSIWRKDWLEAVGIDRLPVTLAEFEDAFYKITDNKDILISKGLTNQKPENIYALSSGRVREPFASIYGAFGYIPFYWALNGNNEIVYGAVQPEMKEALSYLSKWYKDGILNPEFITGENRGDHWSISHDFVEGRIAYTNNGPYYQNMPAKISLLTPKGGKMYRAFVAVNPTEAIEDGRPPVGPTGASGSIVWGQNTGKATVFAKALEKQKDKYGKLLYMIEDLSTNYDDYVLINYGIEDEYWKWEGEMRKSTLPEDEPVEKYGLNGVFLAWSEVLGLCVKDDPKYYEYGESVARYSNNYMDALHGVMLPSYDLYWDEIDKMQKHVYNDIITGKKPIEAFDQFVADWGKAGGEQMTKEANEWYQAATR